MKQVIFLSFYCQVYKKLPTARIYIGDKLIDEIEIPEYYTEDFLKSNKLYFNPAKSFRRSADGKKTSFELTHRDETFKKKHMLDNYAELFKEEFSYFPFKEMPAKRKKIHPKIFVYIINDEVLKSADGLLKIEIKNSDSNHNNGFMSKSTLLMLDTFYIIPYALFENPVEITQRSFDVFSRNSTANDVNKILKYFKMRNTWPINLNLDFTLKEKEIIHNIIFGGNAELYISLKKKRHIWWPEGYKQKGFFYLNHPFIKNFIENFLTKYNCNENQRNTD